MVPQLPSPGYSCQVFRASDLVVTTGVNQGDALELPDALCEGDTYRLRPGAVTLGLLLDTGETGGATRQRLGAGSDIGQPGDMILSCGRLSLLAPGGDLVELLVLRHEPQGSAPGTGPLLALPLTPMALKTDYTLIRASAETGDTRLSDVVCVSFARGTRITLPDGQQAPIETLQPGDMVLTRDHGPQPVRWVGQATLRAQGSFAPVLIPAGVLGNMGDLVVSQHHRMFIYLSGRAQLLPTPELLVPAKYLVDGEHIFIREGGFADYHALAFDDHEIIYAEGIPAESLMVNEALVARLPESLTDGLKARFPALSQSQHFGTEAGPALLERIGRDALIKPREN